MTDQPLYAPPDVDEAAEEWNASCGPCAFAAALHRPVMGVRLWFPGFPRRPWVNIGMMQAALTQSPADWRSVGARWPDYGLAFLGIDGPWSAPGVNPKAAWKHSHWVACAGPLPELGLEIRWVYDANEVLWQPQADWERGILRQILKAHPGSTGYRVRSGIAVRLA